MIIGNNTIELDKVRSTNLYASELLNTVKLSEGSLIVAKEQTEGKGQRGNRWQSSPGKCLTMSIILYPVFIRPVLHFYLNIISALSCVGALRKWVSADILIKWPNDVYYKNKKLGGILIECGITGEQINQAIIGIGINVNQDSFESDLPNPVSLKMILNTEIEMLELRQEICMEMDKYYAELYSGRLDHLKELFESNMYGRNKVLDFMIFGEKKKGIIRGISELGVLEVEMQGILKSFHHGEITWI